MSTPTGSTWFPLRIAELQRQLAYTQAELVSAREAWKRTAAADREALAKAEAELAAEKAAREKAEASVKEWETAYLFLIDQKLKVEAELAATTNLIDQKLKETKRGIMSTLLRDQLTRQGKENGTLRAENARLRFQVAELDFGAGGVLASLRSRKEENAALRQHLAEAVAEQNRLIDARGALRSENEALRQERENALADGDHARESWRRVENERDELAAELALYKPTAKTDIGGTL